MLSVGWCENLQTPHQDGKVEKYSYSSGPQPRARLKIRRYRTLESINGGKCAVTTMINRMHGHEAAEIQADGGKRKKGFY